MEKTRVLLIAQSNTAGVKCHVIDVLSRIDLDAFEVRFVYNLLACDRDFPGLVAAVEARGIRAFELPMLNRPDPKRDLPALFRLIREIRAWRPHIVHAHSSKAGAVGRVAARLAGTGAKTVFTPNVLSIFNSKLYFPIEAALAPLTDVMVASSASEAEDFRRLGIYDGCAIRTIPLCVDADRFRRIEASPRSGPFRIASCGRICPQKGSLLFFQTALAAARAGLDWRFEWIGDYYGSDAESAECRRLLAAHPEMNVEVTGWLDDPTARLAQADVFLLLSRYESFGFVTAETMLLGKTVVATRTTGNIDLVVEGETGFFVERDSADILATLQRVADHPDRAQLGQRGRARIEREFPISRMIALTEQLYRDLAREAADEGGYLSA
jgi:glycosyltransferase involved in cell wall biosynthesis